jgi:hypothetical protein
VKPPDVPEVVASGGTKVITTSEAHLECDEAPTESGTTTPPKRSFKYKYSHPDELIIGNKENLRKTRYAFRQETLSDDGWIVAMQEELNQFQI